MRFRLLFAAFAFLLAGGYTTTHVLPELQLQRTQRLASALPGQLVRHGAAMVEVVEQAEVHTAVRVVRREAAGPFLAVVSGGALAGLLTLFGLMTASRRREPVYLPQELLEEDEEGCGFTHARFGFEGASRELEDWEIAQLYGDPAASHPPAEITG